MEPSDGLTPRYQHNCPSCVFLGQIDEYDLYWCSQMGLPTVLARWSDDGPDYLSGLFPDQPGSPLTEAKRRAVRRGLTLEASEEPPSAPQKQDAAPSSGFTYATRRLIDAYRTGATIDKDAYLDTYCARDVDREAVWQHFLSWVAAEEQRQDAEEQYQTRSLILGRRP